MNPQSYHQKEMEQRIRRFDSECVAAVHHIGRLQEQARTFLNQLSCEPRELKHRFLQYTKQLDEFMYAVTEFNLAASTLDSNATAKEDNAGINTDLYHPSLNHGTDQISTSHSNMQRLDTGDKKLDERENKELNVTNSFKEENLGECNSKTVEDIPNEDNITAPVGLPPQPKLDPETVHEASIMAVDGAQLWLVVDDTSLLKLTEEMYSHYQNREMVEDYVPNSFCAYYDAIETKYFLRALYITSEENDPEVFLVDTGEFQPAVKGRLYPLAPQFTVTPPLAHLCYLADVDQTEDKCLEDKQTDFLKQYLGRRYKMKLVQDGGEDNIVYMFLDDGTTVNALVQALASNDAELNNNSKTCKINNDYKSTEENVKIPNSEEEININNRITNTKDENINGIDLETIMNENKLLSDPINDKMGNGDNIQEIDPVNMKAIEDMDLDDDLDYSKCPEYENPVEAVAGYSNRDEMDICKHYKGGEGCFKGSRCKKRHVNIHPDGWTLDRVPIHVKCRPAPLPAPGTWHKVKVTHVDDTCRLYVHFEGPEEPMSLADLVDEMTLAAENSRPLQLEPAPGELVSARFSDARYYRARVIGADEKIEVMYIDYGNTSLVSADQLRPLQPRWLALPAHAVLCTLAGVPGGGVPDVPGGGVPDVPDMLGVPGDGGSCAEMLKQLVLDKTVEALIIARGYDELTVKLVDDGFDVGEQLAAFAGFVLLPYEVEHDAQRRYLHLPA